MSSYTIPAGTVIATAEARAVVTPDMNLEQRIRACMGATKNHWMETDPRRRYQSALAAALLETHDQREQENLITSTRFVTQVSAMLDANTTNDRDEDSISGAGSPRRTSRSTRTRRR